MIFAALRTGERLCRCWYSIRSTGRWFTNPTIRFWQKLAPHESPSEIDGAECITCLEGIAEHYIGASISLAGVILDPSTPPSSWVKIQSSLQQTSQQYIATSTPLAGIILTPAPLAG